MIPSAHITEPYTKVSLPQPASRSRVPKPVILWDPPRARARSSLPLVWITHSLFSACDAEAARASDRSDMI